MQDDFIGETNLSAVLDEGIFTSLSPFAVSNLGRGGGAL